MKKKTVDTLELPASKENLEEALLFFRERLEAEKISNEIVSETMLVVEALFHNLLEQGITPDTTLRLSCRNRLGNMMIKIGFEGKPAYLYSMEDGELSPEDHILQAYEDKISHSYFSGYNAFQISVKRKHLKLLLYCAIAALCAVLVYLPMHFLLPLKERYMFLGSFVLPVDRILGNVFLMIGAPVTFFSLLKNMVNTYLLSSRYSEVRKLRIKSIVTALIITLLALGTEFLLLSPFRMEAEAPAEAANAWSAVAEIISGAIPSSIFEPFESFSPVPLILLALIVVFALSSTGRYFETLKKAVDVGYALFSRMLGLLMYIFPLFVFPSTLEILLYGIEGVLWPVIAVILLILAGMSVIVAFYLIRLKIGGVRLKPFLCGLPPLLLENIRINSAIDALPFNIRYCVRHYGMDRKRLERALPALSQTMFDGNCYFLMAIAIFIAFDTGVNFTWYGLLILVFLVVFLSLGAPNQPGGILVGTLILFTHLLSDRGYDYAIIMFVAVFFEAAFGVFQNLLNVMGDIVTVAIEEQSMKS